MAGRATRTRGPRLREIVWRRYRTLMRRLVAADLEITSAFSDAATQRRFWRIDEFAQVPCGGTHLRRTGEVGEITLKRENPGGGKERIEIRLATQDPAR